MRSLNSKAPSRTGPVSRAGRLWRVPLVARPSADEDATWFGRPLGNWTPYDSWAGHQARNESRCCGVQVVSYQLRGVWQHVKGRLMLTVYGQLDLDTLCRSGTASTLHRVAGKFPQRAPETHEPHAIL